MKIYNEYLEVGKNKIEVRCFMNNKNSTEKNTIILLHEGLGCVKMWKDWPEKLSQRLSNNIIVYSRLGMGNSSINKKEKTTDFMNEEALYYLPKIIKKYSNSNPILLGHSDGASIALIYAGNSLPCKALILEAPHVIVEPITINEIKNIKKKWKNSILREKLKKYHNNPDISFFSWCNVWLSKSFSAWNITNIIKNISCPILLLQGDKDQYGTIRQLNLIEKFANTYVRKIMIENCKHSPHLEFSKVVIDYVDEFIQDILIQYDQV
ncbi:MAG: 2-succinyl-6-hydroxy-2,4-cyclohexadiene-1-carboxylate synthase [Alphaproteobacteria bacterium MarineAlpha9_Bin4]|nr:hydrolase [Pelagibacterales bacterium]PPR26544.1 MAG: 2-succinyl-6-hydroxy-2,4-cyclohexadiene-1-carboxylate synthase [Alphaproteobacteria bacterium MarineAlpha9_Bin4]|tara:strand:+ start:1156 stop:1953 length:798 start_codon:yes stop_codon:yes gene_type:complete